MNISRCISVVITVLTMLLAEHVYGQWVATGTYTGRVYSLVTKGSEIFAGTNGGGVLLSTNSGLTWTAASTGLSNPYVWSLAVSDTNIFAGTIGGGGIFRTTNDGKSWTDANTGIGDATVAALAVIGSNVFAGTNGFAGGVYLSTDEGAHWSPTSATNTYVMSLGTDGVNLLIGTYGNGALLSPDNGTSLTTMNTGLTNLFVQAFIVNGADLFVGTGGGIFMSTDGSTWALSDSATLKTSVLSFAVSGSNIFAGIYGGVLLSTDNGTTWNPVDSGFAGNPNVYSLVVSGKYLIAGTDGGVYRRPISQMVTAVSKNGNLRPTHFSLSQNYPNPFNPTTIINYDIPRLSHVTLIIYDILGRQVEELMNGEKAPGRYQAMFNASNLPSGVYFYRLQAGPYSKAMKLLLLK